jgi:hypothetical protein
LRAARRTETERFTVFDYAELVARADKANLDISWLRDPDAEGGDNLPPPEVIATSSHPRTTETDGGAYARGVPLNTPTTVGTVSV